MKVYKYLTPALAAFVLAGCGDEPIVDYVPPTPPSTENPDDDNDHNSGTPSLESVSFLGASADAPFEFWDTWGSGTAFTTVAHAQYEQVLELTGGDAWGDMSSAIAWGNEEGVTINMQKITHASFKVKSDTADAVTVGMQSQYDEQAIPFNLSEGTVLSDGWVEVQVAIDGYSDTTWFSLIFEGAEFVEIADLKLTSDGSNDNVTNPAADEFVIMSSTGEAIDLDFGVANVTEWSTGSEFDGEASYLGKSGWEIKSGTLSPEEGNWGAVLVLEGGVSKDLSQFNHVDVSIATKGGYDRYAVAITSNGVGHEVVLPVDDAKHDAWQNIRVGLDQFGLDISKVTSVAIMGVASPAGGSAFYVTDFKIVKDKGMIKDSNIEPEMGIVHSGKALELGWLNYGEWSTGTKFEQVTYKGLTALEMIENGSWGSVVALSDERATDEAPKTLEVDLSLYTNLRFKVAATGDYNGFELFIGSAKGDKSADQKVAFSLENQEEWNTIDISLDAFSNDLSGISQIAIYGIYTPERTGQRMYITDFHAYDKGLHHQPASMKDYGDRVIFIDESGEGSDLAFDDSPTLGAGNAAFNDWSTGTAPDLAASYDGKAAWQLTKGEGWGTVVAFTGDIFGEIQTFDFDLASYKNMRFDIASPDGQADFMLFFGTTSGAEYRAAFKVEAGWTTHSLDLSTLALQLDKINHIAIYTENGTAGDAFYLTNLHFSK